MKILHLMAGLGGASGVANIALRFARVQRERGDEVVMLAPTVKWNPIYFGLCFAIRAWWNARTADEIWVHCSWTFPVWYGAWLARLFGKKLVVVPEGSFDPKRLHNHAGWKKRLVAPLDRWVLRRADEVLALCKDEIEWVKGFDPSAKVRFEKVPLFIKDEFLQSPPPPISSTAPLHVLFLGRAEDPLKGVRFLELAVREIGLGQRSRSTVEEEFVIVTGTDAPFRKTKDALVWARATGLIGRMGESETGGKAYAYRVNEIEVLPGTLGGKIAPATYPTDTTSICGSILLQGVVDVNGRRGEPKAGFEHSEHSNIRTLELRIVSNHFGEELERDWQWCDVLVLPTLSENFGLVVAEALERGKRVVTTDGAPAWEPEGSKKEKGKVKKCGRLIYLTGYRDGTDEERVKLLKEALVGLMEQNG